MIVFTLRTDKPESEIGLYDGQKQLAYEVWDAHRKLAETLHTKIDGIISSQDLTLQKIDGIVVFKGPGSFTGLRIGIATANALAYSLQIPIVASTDNWIEQGIERLAEGKNDKVALPEYGQAVNITTPRK